MINKIAKIFLLYLFLIFASFFLQSCYCDQNPSYFFFTKAYVAPSESIKSGFTSYYYVLNDSSSIEIDSCFFIFSFNKQRIATTFKPNFSLDNTAYACSDAGSYPKDPIVELTIIANNDYNDQIKKKSIFALSDLEIYSRSVSNIKELLDNLNINQNLAISFIPKPYKNTYQSFTFRMKTRDNQLFEAKTKPILFIK